MKIYEEKNLAYFDFWGPASDNASKLTYEDMQTIESILEMEDFEYKGIDATYLNDIFAYDFGYICELLGLTEEEVLNRE